MSEYFGIYPEFTVIAEQGTFSVFLLPKMSEFSAAFIYLLILW